MAGGASAKNNPAATGASASRRKSLRIRSTPIPTQAPTHALRENVKATAAARAGMMTAGQIQSFRSNRMRAAAEHSTSISSPE